jgi:uncharacterized protein YecE (DUF72 family)
MKPVHVGCSGWNYRDWKDRLYEGRPAKQWLELYAEVFETVELNNTFYRLPSDSAVQGWIERTPAGFIFAVKASRYLTHVKRLASPADGVARFWERIEPLQRASKLGPVLWQLPESFKRDDDRLASALDALPRGRHCFEFRHESWFDPSVYELLREHGVALVIGDHPERPFQAQEMTADWTFLRLHYGRRGRKGNYSRSELEQWKRRIAAWRRDVEIFAYFNNDWEGFAVDNALWLKEHLS